MSLLKELQERKQLCDNLIKKVFEDAAFEVMDENLDQIARAQLIERAANEAHRLRSDYISWSEEEISKDYWKKFHRRLDDGRSFKV